MVAPVTNCLYVIPRKYTQQFRIVLSNSGAWVYADSMFADFDGDTIVGVYSGVTSSFVRCTFAANNIFEHSHGTAVIQANAGDEIGDSEVNLLCFGLLLFPFLVHLMHYHHALHAFRFK